MPVAGRSLRASCPALTACPLRFAILASLAPTARLSGMGTPSLDAPGPVAAAPGPAEARINGSREVAPPPDRLQRPPAAPQPTRSAERHGRQEGGRASQGHLGCP